MIFNIFKHIKKISTLWSTLIISCIKNAFSTEFFKIVENFLWVWALNKHIAEAEMRVQDPLCNCNRCVIVYSLFLKRIIIIISQYTWQGKTLFAMSYNKQNMQCTKIQKIFWASSSNRSNLMGVSSLNLYGLLLLVKVSVENGK